MNSSSRQYGVGHTVLAWLAALGTTAVIISGTACSDTTGPTQFVRILPASPSVAMQPSAYGPVLNTSVTLTNTSSHPVGYSACGVSLEKAGLPELPPGKSDWTLVWSQICYLLDATGQLSTGAVSNPVLSPIILQPGASVTIPISAIAGQQPYPSFTGEAGLYRFRVPLSVQIFGKSYPLSSAQSVSEPFAVIPAQ